MAGQRVLERLEHILEAISRIERFMKGKRRGRFLSDPQLVWRGKDEQDAEDLIVNTVPIYIQEKIQPKAIIDDVGRRRPIRPPRHGPAAPAP